MMTKPEKNYAPIEVESLAILFSLEKNHLYLHGLKHFTVCTDHKPLVTLYSQYRKEISARVHRHKLALQGKYNFTVVWEAGKDNPADYNSRHPGRSTVDEAATDTEIGVCAVVVDAIPDAVTLQQVVEATEKDLKLHLLKQAVNIGHLDTAQHPQLTEYARFFDELAIIEGIICRTDKVLVPEALQSTMVDIAHEAHQGLTKTKQYLRSRMWFPRMDSMVEERLRLCTSCQAVTETNQRDPINTTEMPARPWSTLCTDLFGPLPTGEYLLLVQDLHSRFPEVAITHSTSAAAVIPAMDRILASYGTPEVLGSDNGPPFNSTEFRKFAKKLGFHHRKITPLAPWANGTAERFMKNLSKVVQIAHADRKDWRHELTKFLRAYRATPHSMTGATPASMLFNGREYHTNLPMIRSAVATPEQQEAREKDHMNKGRMKAQADKHSRVRQSDFQVGDRVLLKQKKRDKLTTAYETVPYTVEEVKGSQITASNQIHRVCRHANLFKKLPGRVLVDEGELPDDNHESGSEASTQSEDQEATAARTQPTVGSRTQRMNTESPEQHQVQTDVPDRQRTQLGDAEPESHHTQAEAVPSQETRPQNEATQHTEEGANPSRAPAAAPPGILRRSQRKDVKIPVRFRDPDRV